MTIVKAVLGYVRHQPVAFVALFFALGSGAYAAGILPPNSVGTRQIKNRAVTPHKLARSTIMMLNRRRGPTGPTGPTGPAGPAGQNGTNATVDGLPAGGDLAGTYPDPTAATVLGGKTPLYAGETASGDLSGAYPAPLIDTARVQSRVTGTCTSGAIKAISPDGTVTCNPSQVESGSSTSIPGNGNETNLLNVPGVGELSVFCAESSSTINWRVANSASDNIYALVSEEGHAPFLSEIGTGTESTYGDNLPATVVFQFLTSPVTTVTANIASFDGSHCAGSAQSVTG
jgi:hypothetical protein